MPAIETSEFRIHYLERGAGPPVLALHSAGLGAGQWRPLMGVMADRYRLLAPNMRGYGRSSPWPAGAPADLAAELEAIRTLIEAVGEPVHLVGHSMGALLALRLCAAMPESIRQVALIEPVVLGVLRSEGEADALREVGAMIRDFGALHAGGDVNRAMARFTDYWYGDGTWQSFPAAQRLPIFARADKMAADVEAVWADRIPLADHARACRGALIIAAETTSEAARCMARHLHNALPGACLKTVAGAGHLAPATHPADIAWLLDHHLGDSA